MKPTVKLVAIVMALTTSSQGVTTISGTLGSAFKDNGLVNNVPSGSLVMLIADTGTAGFLNQASSGSVTASLTAQAGKTITTGQAGFTAGSNFGGDTVINTSLTGGAGSIASILAGVDITSYLNKNFAVVWFTQTPAALALSATNAYFGMIRLSDWTIPADADGKTYTFSSTDASGGTSFFSTSGATTAAQLGAGGFITGSGLAIASPASSDIIKGATFQIIPEPSAALLGALGTLVLLRRRRN